MARSLDGRTALVTGGTRSIGLAIARAFIAEGASVAINGRTTEVGRDAAEYLGSNAVFVKGDVGDTDSIVRFVEEATLKLGRIDVLVNNAGGESRFAPVAELDDEVWTNCLNINLTSAFRVSRRVLPGMIERRFGRIVNISSVEGKHAKAGLSHYVAAKHGLNGFTKALAKEVGAYGITVNAICPGVVLTELVQKHAASAAQAMGLTAQQMLDQFAKESAIGRATTVEEVAAMAVLLASNVGGGITGAQISVDGGTAAY
jgi:3-hydroxybutyrate dehydrogenase